MKFGVIGLFFISSLAFSQNQEIIEPVIEPLNIERVFVPEGFDDNDKVQVAVTGILTDTCWAVGDTKLTRNGSHISVGVDGIRQGCFCIPVQVPFHRVIDLGVLPAGNYWMSFNDKKILHRFSVSRATTSSPDSILYANVLSAHTNGTQLVIKGVHPDRSFYIKQISVSKQPDGTIVILPQVAQQPIIRESVTVPFTQEIDLSAHVEPEQISLIHIRSMNGNAVNLVETF